MTLFELIRLIITLVGTVVGLTILWHKLNPKKVQEPPCESCAKLCQKRRRGSGQFRYYCRPNGGFDKPPEYCCAYRKREGDSNG